MYPEGAKRRTVLKTVGAAVGSLGVVGTASAGGRGRNRGLQNQLRVARQATEKYKRGNGGIEAALDDGFEIMGPYVPDMGWHLADFDRIPSGSSQSTGIANPAGLTYNLRRELGSVEYIIPLDESKPDMFNDRGAEEHGWHPHHGAQHVYAKGGVEDPDNPGDNYEHASLEDLLNPSHWMELSDEHPAFPDEIDGLAVGDEVEIPWGNPKAPEEERTVDGLITHDDWWTLHAWVHFENPEGVFAPFNHSDSWDPLPAPPHH